MSALISARNSEPGITNIANLPGVVLPPKLNPAPLPTTTAIASPDVSEPTTAASAVSAVPPGLSNVERGLATVGDLTLPLPIVPFAPVAVIGAAVKLPQINGWDDAWTVFSQGLDVMTRWDSTDPLLVGSRGFIETAEEYDYKFLGSKHPRMEDPQALLIKELVWNALEDSGYCPSMLATMPGRVGLYGDLNPFYSYEMISHVMKGFDDISVMTPQLLFTSSYTVPFKILVGVANGIRAHGPVLHISSACSTSAACMLAACDALHSRRIEIGIATAATVGHPRRPITGYSKESKGLYSVDGFVRPFEARASGFVPSEGGAVLILKTVEAASRDNDVIHAVIDGVGVCSDPSVLPSPDAISATLVAKCIVEAMSTAGVKSSDEIGYVECHGSATTVGDFSEIVALRAALQHPTKSRFCAIGGSKANVGHLGGCPGLVSVMKAALILKYNFIPPLANFENPSPITDHILKQPGCPVFLPKVGHTPATPITKIGVQCSGPGGGYHWILSKPAPMPAFVESTVSRRTFIFCTSAKTSTANVTLSENTTKLICDKLQRPDGIEFALNSEWTLQTRREYFLERSSVVVTLSLGGMNFVAHRNLCNSPYLSLAIDFPQAVVRALAPVRNSVANQNEDVRVAFVFSGFGVCSRQAAKELYHQYPVYRETFDRCSKYIQELTQGERNIVLSADDLAIDSAEDTYFIALAFVTLQLSISQLLLSWGIEPTQGMVCHSLGEYACAVASGMLTIEECLKLTKLRFDLLTKLPTVAAVVVSMVVVKRVCDLVAEINKLDGAASSDDQIEVTVMNSPTTCMVLGPHVKVDALLLKLKGTPCKTTTFAPTPSHSKKVSPVLQQFRDAFVGMNIPVRSGKYRYISTLNADWGKLEDLSSADHFCEALCHPVLFHQSMQKLFTSWLAESAAAQDSQKVRKMIIFEIGASLSTHIHDIAYAECGELPSDQAPASVLALPLFLHQRNSTLNAAQHLCVQLGTSWVNGAKFSWTKYSESAGGARRHVVPLCLYPYERVKTTFDVPTEPLSREAFFEKLMEMPQPASAQETAPSTTEIPTVLGSTLTPKEVGVIAEKWTLFVHTPPKTEGDNFFEFGATSLTAMQMISSINRVLGLTFQSVTFTATTPTFGNLVRAYSQHKVSRT
ncbi:polyketide synthase [Pelomyxa schiedti]|nr:polyketide synthase [Pelomyxa schiedti]